MKGENLLAQIKRTCALVEKANDCPLCIVMSEETFNSLGLSRSGGEPRIGHTRIVFKNFLKFGTAYVCRDPDLLILDY
jgi:hypothetical protein